jgi:hypothetical protein
METENTLKSIDDRLKIIDERLKIFEQKWEDIYKPISYKIINCPGILYDTDIRLLTETETEKCPLAKLYIKK